MICVKLNYKAKELWCNISLPIDLYPAITYVHCDKICHKDLSLSSLSCFFFSFCSFLSSLSVSLSISFSEVDLYNFELRV